MFTFIIMRHDADGVQSVHDYLSLYVAEAIWARWARGIARRELRDDADASAYSVFAGTTATGFREIFRATRGSDGNQQAGRS